MKRFILLSTVLLVALLHQSNSFTEISIDRLLALNESSTIERTHNTTKAIRKTTPTEKVTKKEGLNFKPFFVDGDNDDDGVLDDVDLDDDNDGILDTDEGACYLSADFGPQTDGTPWLNLINDLIPIGEAGFEDFESQAENTEIDGTVFSDFSITATGGIASDWDNVEYNNTPLSGSIQATIEDLGINNTIDITFNDPIIGFGINIGDLHDALTNASTLEIRFGGTLVWSSSAVYPGATGIATNTISGETTTVGNDLYFFLGFFDPDNATTDISITLIGGVMDNFVFDDISYIFSDSDVCYVDTDADGTPDYFDTDSDNDGCSDANEQYGTAFGGVNQIDTNSDGTYGGVVGTADVDADGTITGLTYATTVNVNVITIGTDTDFDGIIDTCDDEFNDNDADGIPDFTDLDDDNDGILDTDEGACYLSGDFGPQTDGTSWLNLINDLITIGEAGFENFESQIENTEIDGTVFSDFSITATGGIESDWDNVDYNVTPLSGSIQGSIEDLGINNTIDITFNEPIIGFGINIGDLHDALTNASTLEIRVGGTLVWSSTAVYPGATGIATNTISGETTTVGNDIYFFIGHFNPNNPTTDVSITLIGGVMDSFVFDDMSYIFSDSDVCYVDTDADGTPDHFDTDSDNDGCSDADEQYGTAFGGANQIDTNSDGTYGGVVGIGDVAADGTITGLTYTTAVNANVIGAGADTDFDIIADTCDDEFSDYDADGIPDALDRDDDNDGIIDVIESLGFNPTDTATCIFSSANFSATSPPTTAVLEGTTVITGGVEQVTDVTGLVGDQYRFYNVVTIDANPLDALITIIAADSNIPEASFSIDDDTTGDAAAWQASYNVLAGESSEMEFRIQFVSPNSTSAVSLSRFSGVFYDIDGQNANESITLQNPGAFAVETPTLLEVEQFYTGAVTFQGPVNTFPGIVLNTDLAVYFNYFDVSEFTFSTNADNITNALNSNFFSLVFDPCVISTFTDPSYVVNTGVDSDNDGLPDYQDTDSDNDGCVDAIEAAGTFTAADIDAEDSLGDDVDTDETSNSYGIPLSAGEGQISTSDVLIAGPDTDKDGISDACDADESRSDFDNDGISDNDDFDDDNDGIPDAVEGGPLCTDSSDVSMNTFPYDLDTPLQGQLPSTPLEFNNGQYLFTARLIDGADDPDTPSWQGGVEMRDDQGPLVGDYIYVQPIGVGSVASGDYVEYEFSFPEALKEFSVTYAGLNYGDYAEIRAFNGTDEISVGPSNFDDFNPVNDPTSTEDWIVLGNKVVGNNQGGGVDVNTNFFKTTIVGPITKLIIYSGKSSNSNATATAAFHTAIACTVGLGTNTDGDEFPDYLDYDSDDDGISDIDEAGHGLTDTDGDSQLEGPFGIDGIPDAVQDDPDDKVHNYILFDTDLDGIDNFRDIDDDGDGVLTIQETIDGTDPLVSCDLVYTNITLAPTAAWNALDCDEDGVLNGQEVIDGTDPTDTCDLLEESITETQGPIFNLADCDRDGVTNGQEKLDNTEYKDPCDLLLDSVTLTPNDEWFTLDCDGDNLTYSEELIIATDPFDADTDDDLINDGQEFSDNTNPLDPCESFGGTPPSSAKCDIKVRNTLMTPDGDGNNDIFRILNIEEFPDNTVDIYNRWGVKAFTTTGYDNETNAFSGISNGRVIMNKNESLPAGIYYYVINYNDNSENKTVTGYLYINQ